MLVIAFHEFSHALMCVLTGGHVKSISLQPNEGGVTHMTGAKQALTLPAGYLGSSLIGALLIFCGFDIVASKVASIVLGVCFLLTLWWARRDWLTIVTVLLAVGLLVGMWFADHAEPLRFVVVSSWRPKVSTNASLLTCEIALHRRNELPLQLLGHRKHPLSFLLFHLHAANQVLTVRRPHLAQSEQLRRKRLRPALRRLLAVLGRYLVHHLARLHGGGDRRRHRCVPRIICTAGAGLCWLHTYVLDTVEISMNVG
jgi:hypothetical protein